MWTWKSPQTTKPSINEFVFDIFQPKQTGEKIWKIATEEIFDTWDQGMLDKNFRAKCLHPLSQSLPVNTLCKILKSYIQQNAYTTMQEISKKYENILEPYHSINHDKSKELKRNDEIKNNVWWKLHINVAPEHVVVVSNYLTKEWINHKYISWWEIEDGKIFTIYTGSYETTKKVAEMISHDIQKYLCKPEDNSEIEFAPGVIGRFRYESLVTDPQKSFPYGTCWFSVDRTLKSLWVKRMELISYRRLKTKFGKYFHE